MLSKGGEDDVLEEVYLCGTDGESYNYNYHNPETNKGNPKFKINMIFPTIKDVGKSISMYVTTR
jgi:hypothetical protein